VSSGQLATVQKRECRFVSGGCFRFGLLPFAFKSPFLFAPLTLPTPNLFFDAALFAFGVAWMPE
jgi:hypothetical protein